MGFHALSRVVIRDCCTGWDVDDGAIEAGVVVAEMQVESHGKSP